MIKELPGLIFSLIVTIIIILFFVFIVIPIVFHEKILEYKIIQAVGEAVNKDNYIGYISINPIKYDVLFDIENNKIIIVKCHLDNINLEKTDSSCTNNCHLRRSFNGCETLKSYKLSKEIEIVSITKFGINKYIMRNYTNLNPPPYNFDIFIVADKIKNREEILRVKDEFGNLKNISIFSLNYLVPSGTNQYHAKDPSSGLGIEYFIVNNDIFKTTTDIPITVESYSNKIKFSVGVKI